MCLFCTLALAFSLQWFLYIIFNLIVIRYGQSNDSSLQLAHLRHHASKSIINKCFSKSSIAQSRAHFCGLVAKQFYPSCGHSCPLLCHSIRLLCLTVFHRQYSGLAVTASFGWRQSFAFEHWAYFEIQKLHLYGSKVKSKWHIWSAFGVKSWHPFSCNEANPDYY